MYQFKYKDQNITNICEVCREKFAMKNSHNKYCSRECGRKKWSSLYKSVVPEGETYSDTAQKKWGLGNQLICTNCKKLFRKKHLTQKYCSPICRNKFNVLAQRLKYVREI